MNTAQDFFDAANAAELREDYSEANRLYEKAIQLQPEFHEAHFNRGVNWLIEEKHSKAMHDFQKSLSFNPRIWDTHYNIAEIYADDASGDLFNLDKAILHAREACKLCDYAKHVPVGLLAAVYAKKNNFAKAIKFQKKAISSLVEKNRIEHRMEVDMYLPEFSEKLGEYKLKYREQSFVTRWLSRIR